MKYGGKNYLIVLRTDTLILDGMVQKNICIFEYIVEFIFKIVHSTKQLNRGCPLINEMDLSYYI